MKITAQIITAANVGLGMYAKYGVSKENAKITIPVVYTQATGVRIPLAPPTAALENAALTG